MKEAIVSKRYTGRTKKEFYMAIQLNSYISFDGNAREAAEYYHSVFGGELSVDTMGEYDSEEMPVASEDRDKVMHAQVKSEHLALMMADVPTGVPFDGGARISLTLNGDDADTLTGYWERLAADGTITLPMGNSPWGSKFGMLTDKFGINWMFDISPVQS